MAAAMTFVVSIPANNTHWKVEIVKRGGGIWYFDKKGHMGWMWTVDPISYTRQPKPVIVPSSQPKPNTVREEL
jgi:hypothetical protein